MDIIDRVRSFGRGAEPLSAEHLAPARARLQAAIAREPSAARKDKWGTRWALPSLVLGGAAAAAVAAVVIVPLSAQSAAAQVLQGAASLSVTATNITVPSGEYLRIESKSTSLVLWDVDMPTPWARFNNGNPRSAEAGLDVLSSRTIYVPANHSGDWIVSDTNREVVGVTGNRSGEAQEDWSRFFAAPPGQTAIYPGGSSLTPDGGKPSYLDNRDVYSEMPRDPRALLNWWRDRSGLEGDDADRWAVSGIAHDLSVNLAPADLRAAMFDALSLIDGAKVLSTNGDTSTLAFPWRLASRSLETRLTIDVERGLITAVSELEFVSGTIFDSPVVLHETTVSTDIVSAVAP